MFRTDYSPNRLEACKSAILKYCQVRNDSDASTGFALVTFNSKSQKLLDFNDSPNYSEIYDAIEDLKTGGKSSLGDAIAAAIQMHIEQLRLAGAKVPRIVIFSDGKYTKSQMDPFKMSNLAQQLGFRIDTFRLGEVEHFNIMKRLSDVTDGKYSYSNDAGQLMLAVQEAAESNIGKMGEGYQKSSKFTAVLKKVAAPLKTIAEMNKGDKQELIERIRGTAQFNQCTICYDGECPVCTSSFSICGRYCPNCAAPMHLHCAAGWAEANSPESGGTIFRCVHCHYLIGVPKEVVQTAKIHEEMKEEIQREKNQSYGQTNAIFCKPEKVMDLGDAALYSSCPVCNSIFDEEEVVNPCGNVGCNAIYHKECFSKLEQEICKICGAQLTNHL